MRLEYLVTPQKKESEWGKGEWISEPDEVHFEYKSYNCKVLRVIIPEAGKLCLGHLCGYVRVGQKDISGKEESVEIHGGLTYRNMELDGFWWGFDCAHSYDVVPGMQKVHLQIQEEVSTRMPPDLAERYKNSPIFRRDYRNVEYCIEQCKSLVDQIMEMELNE